MSRKEEIKKESSIFSEREAHGHQYRDLMCGFEAGAQWADETMIEKACVWLKDNLPNWVDSYKEDIIIENFKKAMEDKL